MRCHYKASLLVAYQSSSSTLANWLLIAHYLALAFHWMFTAAWLSLVNYHCLVSSSCVLSIFVLVLFAFLVARCTPDSGFPPSPKAITKMQNFLGRFAFWAPSVCATEPRADLIEICKRTVCWLLDGVQLQTAANQIFTPSAMKVVAILPAGLGHYWSRHLVDPWQCVGRRSAVRGQIQLSQE